MRCVDHCLAIVAVDAFAISESVLVAIRHRADDGGLEAAFGGADLVAIHEFVAAIAIFPTICDD